MSDADAQSPEGEERSCQRCGEPLAPKAAFCRSCGAKYEAPTPPEPDVEAEKTEVRKPKPTAAMPAESSCDKCGATLAASSAFCRACGTPVPAEGAPTQKLDAAPTPPSPPPSRLAPPPPASPPPPSPPPPPPREPAPLASAGGSRSKTPIVIGGVLVLLLGAGVAVAIVASKSSSASNPTTTVEQVGIPGSEAAYEEEPGGEMIETEEEPGEAEEEVSSSGFPEISRPQMNEEITSLLQGYHEDVVEEDFQGAWAMLSPRKRRQYLREYGYHKWAAAQASLSPYLDPYGLEANVVSLEGEGVARVDVTGMDWSKPGAPCSEWSGLTWVKYEGDEWAYDPGYSTTSARRATWRPRSARLLGGDCAE
jgi:ribosomal protein L40E